MYLSDGNREACEEAVKGYPRAKFKGFSSHAAATSFVEGNRLKEKVEAEREGNNMFMQSSIIESSNGTIPFNNSTSSRNNASRPPSYARMESYDHVDGNDDDVVVIESLPTRKSAVDGNSFRSTARKRSRSSPDPFTREYKKFKMENLEVIDLTDSPPKRRSSQMSQHSSISHHPPITSARCTEPSTSLECSPEQLRILDLVEQGKNVFFTGSAGVGKSFVLKKICEMFKNMGLQNFKEFFVTASTGTPNERTG